MAESPAILPEVVTAALWWADTLEAVAPQDNGDMLQSQLASSFAEMAVRSNGGRVFIDDERQRFIDALERGLMQHVAGSWERAQTEPNWGSATRSVGCDYGPDRVLGEAADTLELSPQRAAMLSLCWPIKTWMAINPGSVKVSHGYGAELKEIHEVGRHG